MYRFLLLSSLILSGCKAFAAFDFNQNCKKAYDHILCLRLGSARSLIAAEKKQNPQNAIPYLLDNYADYFTLLTTENKADFERLKSLKNDRLSRIEDDDKHSPYYLFAQAEINLQWALMRGRFQEYVAAGFEISKAYNMLQENAEKFPEFLPNQKNLGTINALLGAMPQGLQRTLATFGIRGNTTAGVRILNTLIGKLPGSPYAFFYDEAVFYLSYIQVDIVNDPGAYAKILHNTATISQASLLKTYMRAYAGMKNAHNDEAIKVVQNRPRGGAYQPYPYLEYLMGIARLNRLDKQAAGHFKIYLQQYSGVNYVKDAFLHLAWAELLVGNMAGYESYVTRVKTKGETLHEKDKQALGEANDAPPDVTLLKARLLFDGGYYGRSLAVIQTKKLTDMRSLRDKIEYNYRLGRIYEQTVKPALAINYYQVAMKLGSSQRYYYASNAAYRMGLIYEKSKNYPKSRTMYNTAIAMKNHDYESSIENKAKEGLRRIVKQ